MGTNTELIWKPCALTVVNKAYCMSPGPEEWDNCFHHIRPSSYSPARRAKLSHEMYQEYPKRSARWEDFLFHSLLLSHWEWTTIRSQYFWHSDLYLQDIINLFKVYYELWTVYPFCWKKLLRCNYQPCFSKQIH